MASVAARSLDEPDETRTPDKTTIDVVNLDNVEVGRLTFQPGWRWSECIKPVAGTDTCQAEHLGYAVSGHMHISHDDGTEVDIAPGDAYQIAPGHEAWVVGDEPFVGIEFKSAATFAKG
jgi:quercetin dioxygenase-like cupin family protein